MPLFHETRTGLSQWLKSFLSGRGLPSPDQRPLYAYQATSEEYQDLKRRVAQAGKAGASKADLGFDAAFVFFCAEWYRREYEREFGWTWDPIWQCLGFHLDANDLRQVIPKGLERYWSRPIRYYESERRNFLGSVFSEGGLPFRVLKQSDSRFQSVFARILKRHESARQMGFKTAQVVKLLIEEARLPQAFTEDTSVDLISEMADELVSIVQLNGLDKKSDPVAELDQVNPNWRESFPIPLDDETGTDFLNGLLNSASIQQRSVKRSANIWQCRHFFFELDPSVLHTQVSFPRELTFSLETPASSSRLELAIYEGEQILVSLPPGYAQLEGQRARVRLSVRGITCKRRQLQDELSLVAMDGGVVLASCPVPSSAVGLGEVPLGFVFEDDQWRLSGQASFTTKAEELLLVLPDAASVESAGGDLFRNDDCLGQGTWRLKGQGIAKVYADETFSIKTGAVSTIDSEVALSGETLHWPSKPVHTFLGIPRITGLANDSALAQQGVRLYFAGKPTSQSELHELLGAQHVSVRNQEGEALFRRRVGILPSDFRVELKSGSRPNQGSLLFYTVLPCLFKVLHDSIKVTQTRQGDCMELSLEAVGIPPAQLRIQVEPNLLGEPIELELPFPASGILAFDGRSRPLSSELSVNQLLGARLYMFGRSGVATSYQLELSLKGKEASNAFYRWHYRAGSRPLEVSLAGLRDQVNSLFSLDTGIDHVIEMRVTGGGRDIYFRIKPYDSECELDRNRMLLSFPSFQGGLDEALPRPILMLLSEPERKPVQLISRRSEGVAVGDFEIPASIDKAGPWLVLPHKDSSFSFRPCYVHGACPSLADLGEIKSLQKAVPAFDPRAPVSAFEPVLSSMADNPAHTGWQFLRTLYDEYAYLPLASFEVWRALIKHPPALAMALFKFEMKAEFLSRIEAEFPVFWEFFPVRCLRAADRSFRTFMASKGLQDAAIQPLMSVMYERLASAFPIYEGDLQNWLGSGEIPRGIDLPSAFMEETVKSWYQDLIRQRSQEDWPDYGAGILQQACLGLDDSPISFRPEMDYRGSVVYLPVFAAAVSAGRLTFEHHFPGKSGNSIFFLRKARNFDHDWFNVVYRYCLLKFSLSHEL